MIKLIPIFLLLVISSFVAGSQMIVVGASNQLVEFTAAPTPQMTPNGSPCDGSEFQIINGQTRVRSGGIATFEIRSERKLTGPPIWTVSAGEIISGQGSSKLEVLAPIQDTRKILKQGGTFEVGGSSYDNPHFTVEFQNIDTCFNKVRSSPVYLGNPFENQFANILELNLSTEELWLGCMPEMVSGQTSERMHVFISSSAFDEDNDAIYYDYKVSGGRIIGTGPNVQWDLSGVAPGNYQITAGVDDGCGFCGLPITKDVHVFGCSTRPSSTADQQKQR